MKITLIDLFSGIGGFSLGLKEAGFEIEKHYFSEIDEYSIGVYQNNFKDAKYLGSVTNVRHIIRNINQERKPGDKLLLTFGSPCQDFSMAGKRSGLTGQKSVLIKYALFIIKWIRPDVYIWENVKGAYTSNVGKDFWAIQKAFADIDGYRREQQLLNTEWVLPQNRERIYLIGYAPNRCVGGIFPITENDSVFNESPKSRQGFAQTENCSTIKGNGLKADDTYVCVPTKANCFEHNNFLNDGIRLRRLTEIECERLQGFPDDWTKYALINGKIKQVPKTQRYKQLGNAVTVKIVKIISKKLIKSMI